MADIIIAHGVIITIDPQRRIINDGAIAIEADRIIDIGTSVEIMARHQAATIIEADRKAVMPGFVDAHAHAGHGIIKTLGGNNSDDWHEACELAYSLGSTEAFWYAEGQLAALERVRFGVTSGISLLGGGDAIMRTDSPEYADAHCAAVVDIGSRSIVAVGPTRPPHPRLYASWQGMERRDYLVEFDQQLKSCREIIDKWHQSHNLRINIAMLTATLRQEHRQSLSEADFKKAESQARQARALSRDSGTIFTQDGHTRGSVAFAHSLDLLGPDALLSHSTNLTEEEIAICADTDTKIAHNPSAVASMLGRCPVVELIEAGVTVALGSDATAPDRSGDMFRHIQQAMHYHRTYFRDPDVLPPGRVLEMATIDAAQAVGLGNEIGSLEIGKKADIILVDLARPHMAPFHMPAYRVTCFANGNDVTTVIVDGKILMHESKLIHINEEKVVNAAHHEAELLLDRLNIRHMLDMPENFWKSVRY